MRQSCDTETAVVSPIETPLRNYTAMEGLLNLRIETGERNLDSQWEQVAAKVRDSWEQSLLETDDNNMTLEALSFADQVKVIKSN